jgi:hypothetical protein
MSYVPTLCCPPCSGTITARHSVRFGRASIPWSPTVASSRRVKCFARLPTGRLRICALGRPTTRVYSRRPRRRSGFRDEDLYRPALPAKHRTTEDFEEREKRRCVCYRSRSGREWGRSSRWKSLSRRLRKFPISVSTSRSDAFPSKNLWSKRAGRFSTVFQA